MFKRSLLLSLFVLAGCEPQFDEKRAATLVNEQIGSGCFFTPLTDPTDIRFNTVTRLYDQESKQIIESDTRSFISLVKNPNYDKQHHQLTALEGVGLLDKIASHVNTNGKGGFVTDVQDAPSGTSPTARVTGLQYKLTSIGAGYIKVEPKTNNLNICIGYVRVKNIYLPKTEDGKLPDRMSVSYTIEVRDPPNWANDERVKKEFPSIKDAITEKNNSSGTAVFVNTPKGYVIEN